MALQVERPRQLLGVVLLIFVNVVWVGASELARVSLFDFYL
jgi:hypothetical protein